VAAGRPAPSRQDSKPSNATGVLLTNAGTTDFGSTTITSAGAPRLSATGTGMSTSRLDAITVTGSGEQVTVAQLNT
jgi:hypothetical protein